jgi:hypothetical protein
MENEMNEIITMARQMRTLQAEKEELDERLKFLNLALDDLRLKQIPEAMAEMDIRTLTVEGIGRVQLAMDCYATIKDKAAGYQWLQEHGYDGLVTEYVQPSTFKAAVKEALKKGQSFPDELFSITPFTRASIVKA